MLGESPAPRGVYEPAQATKSSLQGATAGFVRKFFGIPVTNFISAMDAIAPNSDPGLLDDLAYGEGWTLSK